MGKARNIADAEERFVNTAGDTMTGPLVVSGDGFGIATATDGTTRVSLWAGSGQGWVYTETSHPLVFGTNDLARGRFDAGGNFLIGKEESGATLNGFEVNANGATFATLASSANTSATYHVYSSTANAYRFYVGLGGTVFATNTTISAISDQRMKENVQDLDVGLGAVLALKPRKFDWKEGKGKDIKGDRGFIAQEFEQVFPDLIDEWRDPAPEGEAPYKSVRQDLIPVLVKAIQEQQALIVQLQADVAALKA